MKTATDALKALLLTRDFIYLDLYTFYLADGSGVRLSGGDRLIKAALPGISLTDPANGYTWSIGCPISDGGVKAKIGTEVNTVQITLFARPDYPFAGIPLQTFIRARGFVGAKIRIDRAFAPSWSSMIANGATGTINRFYGIYSGIDSMGQTQAVLNVNPMTFLLGQEMPFDVYQLNCANELYGNLCTLNEADYTTTGTFGSGSTKTALVTALSNAAGYYNLGKIRFTSGQNNGLLRLVKSDDGAGNFTILQPLPYAPASGDGFSVSAGCDHTWATCGSKFSNQLAYRGETKIPPPEASL